MRNETNPTRRDIDVDTEPTTEPMRRLHPDKVCPDQQTRIVRRIITDLP